MNVFNNYRQAIERTVKQLCADGSLPPNLNLGRISVEPPRDPEHGDISSNVAMIISNQAKESPREIADRIALGLKLEPGIKTVDVAGPGFINLRLDVSVWQQQITEILSAGTEYGANSLGRGKKINVEYVSANPTGPMHVGHARGAVIGDVLAALLEKSGFEVTREYYINDAGVQVDVLARSAFLRYREVLGDDIGEIPDDLYPGDYLVRVGQEIAKNFGDSLLSEGVEKWLPVVRDFTINAMIDLIRSDLISLGIKHQEFRSEKSLHDENAIEQVVSELKSRDLVYWGTLKPPKGQKRDDWEEREQYLFRSTLFGDDIDRPLRKSDDTWTYFAADIAYHLDKYRRGFREMIDVWGADHKGYVRRMRAAVEAVTNEEGVLDVCICNLVNFLEDGEPVRMSKRAGTFVTLREVVDQVGRDVVRFMMLTRSNEAPLDFDLAKVLEQSRDNPVFYVQYAHVRACSVLRNANDLFPSLSVDDASLSQIDMSVLDDEAELALIRLLASWPRVVETSSIMREPHRIAYYLGDVAAAFHGLWNKGNENVGLRFLIADDEKISAARIAMVRAMAVVIASGLAVMGVKPVEEMR